MASNPNNAQQKQNNWFNPFENFAQINSMMDFAQIKHHISKNMEAFAAANQATLECMKETGARIADSAQKNLQKAMSCKTPQDAHSQETLSFMMQNAISNIKDTAEICAKTTKDVLDIYNKRFQEAVSEFSNK